MARKAPLLAAALANVDGPADDILPRGLLARSQFIPSYSAADVLHDRLPRSKLAGKDVVIGLTSEVLNDVLSIPGHGFLATARMFRPSAPKR